MTLMSRSMTPVKLCTMMMVLDQMLVLLSAGNAGLKELVLVNLRLDVNDLSIELQVEQYGARLDIVAHDVAMLDVPEDVHL